MPPTLLNIHAFLPASRANGPGRRAVLWLQGCSLGCPGCFNPGTHSAAPRTMLEVTELLRKVLALSRGPAPVEGITVSGGEPFEQPAGLLSFLTGLDQAAPHLSVVLFSGLTRKQIAGLPTGPDTLALVDILVDGPYDPTRRLARGLRGSTNQRIHLLTDRYQLDDVEATPGAEVILHAGGSVSLSGIARPGWRGAILRRIRGDRAPDANRTPS